MFNQDGSAPIKNTGREGTYRTQGESGMRPASDPKSQKDFKKILGKDSSDEGDNSDNSNVGEDGVAVGPKTEQANQAPVSLFGLSGSKAKKTLLATDAPPQNIGFTNKTETAALPTPQESPSTLFSRMTTKEPAKLPSEPLMGDSQKIMGEPQKKTETAGSLPGKEIVGSLIDTPKTVETPAPVETPPPLFPSGDKEGTKGSAKDGQDQKKALPDSITTQQTNSIPQTRTPPLVDSVAVPTVSVEETKADTQPKEKFTTRFSTEQTDLSYVNLMAVSPQPITAVEGKVDKAIMPISDIQEIVNQLVDKLYTISQSGKTDTAIILKHPPILAGAQLIVTSFDNAKGEFNISFENLTQAGKNLLDMRLNQESLLNALEQKGYAVHILTTTTLVENRPIPTENTQNQQQQGQSRDDRDQARDGRQRRNQAEDERET